MISPHSAGQVAVILAIATAAFVIAVGANAFEFRRAFAGEPTTIVDAATRWRVGESIRFQPPIGAGFRAENHPDHITPAVRPASPSGDNVYTVNGKTDPTLLRWLVSDGREEDITIGPRMKQRLLQIAERLETDEKVLAGSGDVIAELISTLATAAEPFAGVRLISDEAKRYHAALLADQVDSNRRISAAGLEAAQALSDRDKAVTIIDDQKRYISQLRNAVLDLAEDLDKANLALAEERDRPTEIVFTFSDSNDPAGLGVELGADLALLVTSLRQF